MKKVVKIINCFNENFWYKDKINEQFEVKFADDVTGYYVVDICNGNGDLGSVNPDDCEVFEVENNVVVREITKQPTQEDYLLDLDCKISKIELGL